MRLALSEGDRVIIVGGGPAGSFAALHLLGLTQRSGPRLEVLIFEPRDFERPGPGGCNRCAGILSSRVLRGLDSLQLPLPEDVIQAHLHAYAIHLDEEVLTIDQPNPDRPIVSIYRGGGPRLVDGLPLESFDGYLLSQAQARGARHMRSRVRRVTWEGRPVVHTARERFPADFLVLATGINSRSPLAPDFGYHPPKTAVMAQDEVLLPTGWPSETVRTYFRQPPGLVFGALIPKGQYLNISLLGRNMTTDAVTDFLEAQGLTEDISTTSGSLCGCTPRIAIGPARNYFGDRWVSVGDAAVTRLYKDGIGSAYATAKKAVQVALRRGISRHDFRKAYAPYCRRIASDNNYGRLLFALWSITLQASTLMEGWKRTIQIETQWQADQRLHAQVLWGMFSGDESYRTLFWRSVSFKGLKYLWDGIQGRSKARDGDQ